MRINGCTATTDELFWFNVRKTDTCWIWTGPLMLSGYGRFRRKKVRSSLAHKYAYETLVGPISDGRELNHLCGNKACIRPDPNHVILEPTSNEELFWSKVDKTSGCWLWTAGKLNGVYGQFIGKMPQAKLAHRFAYEILIGEIPVDCELHHVCKNKSCVRPDPEHVVLVMSTNHPDKLSVINQNKTHCSRGHPFDDTNTVVYVRQDGRSHRDCKICQSIRKFEGSNRELVTSLLKEILNGDKR
jgi:HNH endonuclease